MSLSRRMKILREVERELASQDMKWGEQNHEYGTGGELHGFDYSELANSFREWNDSSFTPTTWTGIFLEEVFEALAEEDPVELRKELIQSAAVALQWVEAIDRRQDRVEDVKGSLRLEGISPSLETEARLRRGDDPEQVYQDVLKGIRNDG